MGSGPIKKAKWLGYAITILCFYYLFTIIINMNIDFTQLLNRPGVFTVISLLAIGFTIVVLISAYGWKMILGFIQGEEIPYREAMPIYVKSNIAKYLPGNVMHFVGRNVLGNRMGWQHSNIALSSVIEILLMMTTTLLLTLILAYDKITVVLFDTIDIKKLVFIGMIFLPILLILFLWYRRKKEHQETIKELFTKKFLGLSIKVLVLDAVTFLSAALALVIICKYILGLRIDSLFNLRIISAYIISWMLGFITPGSPGGLGIRESILITLLASFYGREGILVAAVIHRLSFIIGEVLAFLLSIGLRKYTKKLSPTMYSNR